MKDKTLLSKDFILVLIGQIISLFGNQILRYALPLYLLNQTGSSALFGAILACSFIPMLAVFPIGGMIADRMNKKNIMVILDFSTAILTILFLVLEKRVDMIPLIAVMMMLLYGIQGAYQPTVNASIPALVSTNYIMQANSMVNVISSFASMVGPVAGGILFSFFGLSPILYVSVFCFIISAIMEIFIQIPFEKRKSNGNILATGYYDMKESFVFMFKKQPILWKLSFVYGCICLFLNSLIMIAVPVLITQKLGFPADTANRFYGYAQGIIAIGSILGGVLAGVLSKKLRPNMMTYFMAGCALVLLPGGIVLQFCSSPYVIYYCLVIGSSLLLVLSSLFQIQMMSYVQVLTPGNLIGKVISCVICICMCANPIGQFLYGLIFDKIGDFTYILFYIAIFIVLGISIFTRPLFHKIEKLLRK